MGERKRRMWQLLDADRACAAGYTAFREASAPTPVPLRLRGQAQFGRERRSFIYPAGRTAAEALAHSHTILYAHAHTHRGWQATWLHPTIWIFCPICWWKAACLFPETECELCAISFFFRLWSVLWCGFTVLKSCCPMWKCCSAAGYVTGIEVRIKTIAGATVSWCYCVS